MNSQKLHKENISSLLVYQTFNKHLLSVVLYNCNLTDIFGKAEEKTPNILRLPDVRILY